MKKLLILVFFTILSCLATAKEQPSINWKAKPGHAAGKLPELNWNSGSDWLNVRDFGAKGDGKTDDTASLQQAFSKLDDGVVIYFPPGTYIIKDELLIQKTKPRRHADHRLLGTGIYGHGRSTILRWEGKEGGTMIRDRGMLHHRLMGFVFDGNNLAGIGYIHDNNKLFETHIFQEYLAFRNFREYGMFFEKNSKDGASTAEIAFLHSIFENCRIGVSFTSFNDYNYTFDGCLFKDNSQSGVMCTNGNFYIRNSRFENNTIDVEANPEHKSSIRRSVSVNSGSFLKYNNSVAPITVERCFVANWKGKAAIVSSGAPMTLFDNTFKHKNQNAIPVVSSGQKILMGGNKLVGPTKLIQNNKINRFKVELPSVRSVLNENSFFIPTKAILPGRHFDVKRDFGARGDGRVDDTGAIQKAIDAAKAFGNNAIVYLPRGNYRITQPLELTGSNYRLGGSGLFSRIIYAGKPDENAINIHPDGELTLENLAVKRDGCSVRKKIVSWVGGKGADIRQYPSVSGSRVKYHSIYVFGKYCNGPFILGLRLEDLAAHDVVLLENIEGNIHSINSGAATILASISYEGTVWVKGMAKGGCFGILTRLATLSTYSLYVEDNQSLIASDFYIEQALAKTITLCGNAETEPGRITLSIPKLCTSRKGADAQKFSDIVSIENYFGEVNFVATQLYLPGHKFRISVKGEQTKLGIFSSFFYVKSFELSPPNLKFNMLASYGTCKFNIVSLKTPAARNDPAAARNALLDLRRLGELDWKLNYPELLKQNKKNNTITGKLSLENTY